ncbi:MAG TPA: lytic transglycosylase domain-containing protein [Rhodocyclaceae bacterium]|nr:lytic transglycosylase domain-containing protein [Rhodocyclaceae bacterium]
MAVVNNLAAVADPRPSPGRPSRRLACELAACLISVAALAQPPADPDPAGLTAQAIALEFGEGVPKDARKAALLYCSAARLGDAVAMFNLGWMYANARGVARDDGLAALLFAMAAKRGSLQAQNMLVHFGKPSSELPACLRPPEATEPDIEMNAGNASSSPTQRQIIALVRRLAPEYAVSPKLALAVLATESGFDVNARSAKNAQGLMQLLPETAQRFKVVDAFDPVQNLRGGLAYLRWLLAYFKGDVALVAAGYNAGEGAVNRYGGVPPYQETRNYVNSVLGLFKHSQHPYDASITEPSPVLGRVEMARAIRANLNSMSY